MDKPQTTLLLLLIAVPLFVLSRILQPPSKPAPQPDGVPPAAAQHAPAAQSPAWVVEVDGWSIGFEKAVAARIPPMRSRIDNALLRPKPIEAFRSPYDDLIAYHATENGFDWRLVSALISVESGFQPEVESEAGAFGLMQVRKVAAEEVGEEAYWSPDGNIRTGVRYLKWLQNRFAEAKGRDQIAMVLAAYNMGPAHLDDAQSLARRFGYDPNRWYGSLEALLPLLEQPAVHEQLPNGYARGGAVVEYVERILERFDQHRLATSG